MTTRDTAPPPLCKSSRARECAFSLLLELCRESGPNIREMLSLVMRNHQISHSNRVGNTTNFDFATTNEEKSEVG